ncbi:MAG: BamA/TamA family outer membrane protein [Sphingomicrobium sp.]
MSGWGSAGKAARLLCAGASAAVTSAAVAAQALPPPPPIPQPVPDAGDLDPNAPLAPLPGLGVDWPDLQAADGPAPAGTAEPAPSDLASSDIRYDVAVEGLDGLADSAQLLESFRQQSVLVAQRKRVANAAQIARRSRTDADLLGQILRSQGYYDALVEPRTERVGGGLQVVLTAEPGSLYRFASVELPGLQGAGSEAEALRSAFAVKPGDPVVADQVIAGGAALKTALGELGFAQATIGDQDIVVDHGTHRATLNLPVNPGPVARFGAIRVTGRPPFDARHLGVIARFRAGDRFEQSKLDDLRRALIATSLVADAEVRLIPIDGGRTVDVAVKLEPAPTHTIAGELGYGTGEGARVEASWTDRNFFNPEGALTLRGVLGTSEQLAAVQLRRSNFRQRDQLLNLQFSVSHRRYDAYEARTVLLAANIERQSNFIWHKRWTWSYGAELLATDEHGAFSDSGLKDTRTFLIAALPLSLGFDASDSLLDPSRGYRLSARLSPELSAHDGHFTYGRVQIDASTYRPVTDRIVAAGRIRLGTILGAGAYDLAPSRRFYSGGGGSVRGYGYQQLGPKDMDGDPVGGRGLAEFAVEARIRLHQLGGNFGIVPFFDGGTLSTGALPDFRDWRFAAGIGARYYSSFGPIRIDVGVPLNRQRGDGRVAVAVSLGQAF